MHTEIIPYEHDGRQFEGFIAYDETVDGARPGVLVAHAWMGQDDFARDKAVLLAELGYVGFALDVYGVGRRASDRAGAEALMTPLVEDRALLRARLNASLERMKAHEVVDATRTGCIGFCFGGLCAIDLARSGADVTGVVSFHGLLMGDDMPNQRITAKILAMHGWDDPLAPPDQAIGFAKEMTDAGADWQLHAYGGTMHAFTNPNANDVDFGTVYNEAADRRSWQAMRDFFGEVLR